MWKHIHLSVGGALQVLSVWHCLGALACAQEPGGDWLLLVAAVEGVIGTFLDWRRGRD